MDEDGAERRVPDPLAIRREATPERVGLVDAETGEAWTYAELDDVADGVAERTAGLLEGPDPTVGLLVGTRPAVEPLAFGALRAGARVGLLDVNLGSDALRSRLDVLEPDVLICEEATEYAAASADCPVRSLDAPTAPGVDQFDVFGPPAGGVDGERPAAPALGEVIAFTSGTTGDSKAVRLPLETLVASAVASALRLGVASGDRWLVPIPTYHVGGFSPFVRCTQAGTTVVLQRGFDANETIDAIARRNATCVSLVPTQVVRMLEAGWEPPDALRFVLVGGGPVRPSLVDRCRDRGVPVCPTYGATETASQVATARPETAFQNPGTVGRPLAFADVSIVGDGTPLSAGETGEIVVDGPVVTPGYVDPADGAGNVDEDGFHTDDLGHVDDAGRLWIEGRADDRIVTGGETVDAGAVAEVVRSLDGVDDAAVVGIDDAEWGERVAALVVADADLTAEDVRAHCRARLATYAIPKTVAFVDALPSTPSGTVDRTAVERELS